MAFIETYLNDHLAGATAAIFTLEDWSTRAPRSDLRAFFQDMLREIEEDHRTLMSLVRRLNGGPSMVKIMLASVAERFARLKLRTSPERAAGSTFEVLEALSIGIHGKLAMWDALALFPNDERFAGLDLRRLRERAIAQLQRVEQQRLACAPSALR